jgi:hypothetical protein
MRQATLLDRDRVAPLGKTEDTTIADLAELGTKATFKNMAAYPLTST